MSEQPRRRITEKQAEARRQNGKQSQGPKTAEGKRRSAENSTTHGGWSRKLQALDRGPLREDPQELLRFVVGYVRGLDPGDHGILMQMAFDVADKAWRVTRAQRWEAEGYSRQETLNRLVSQADWILVLAEDDRKAAAVVRKLPDPAISSADLWNPYCRLAFHFGATERSLDPLADADAPTRLKALQSLLTQHFKEPEDAAKLLESFAKEREVEAEKIYNSTRPDVVRQELNGAFSRNVERLTTHSSRELDRSLKRYWEQWDRLRDTQPTPENLEHSDQEDYRSDPPVASGRPESAISAKVSQMATQASAGEALDLELFEELLDELLEPTNKNNDHSAASPDMAQ